MMFLEVGCYPKNSMYVCSHLKADVLETEVSFDIHWLVMLKCNLRFRSSHMRTTSHTRIKYFVWIHIQCLNLAFRSFSSFDSVLLSISEWEKLKMTPRDKRIAWRTGCTTYLFAYLSELYILYIHMYNNNYYECSRATLTLNQNLMVSFIGVAPVPEWFVVATLHPAHTKHTRWSYHRYYHYHRRHTKLHSVPFGFGLVVAQRRWTNERTITKHFLSCFVVVCPCLIWR